MNHTYAQNAYKNNQILTAPQNKLVLMLYDGIVKNINMAKLSFEKDDYGKFNEHVIKAQDIVMELMTTLNFEAGGEIAEGLYKLYDYMYFRLIRANVEKNIDYLSEVLKYAEDLRDTWSQI